MENSSDLIHFMGNCRMFPASDQLDSPERNSRPPYVLLLSQLAASIFAVIVGRSEVTPAFAWAHCLIPVLFVMVAPLLVVLPLAIIRACMHAKISLVQSSIIVGLAFALAAMGARGMRPLIGHSPF